MRIYNGKKSTLTIPLSGNQRLSIPPHSISGDFMPNKEFLSLMVTTFDYNEIALVVSGPFEIAMCSQVSGCVGFVCQSLEEAVAKFSTPEAKPSEPKPTAPEEKEEKPLPEEKPTEETKEEPVAPSEEEVTTAPPVEKEKPKRRRVTRKKKEE